MIGLIIHTQHLGINKQNKWFSEKNRRWTDGHVKTGYPVDILTGETLQIIYTKLDALPAWGRLVLHGFYWRNHGFSRNEKIVCVDSKHTFEPNRFRNQTSN